MKKMLCLLMIALLLCALLPAWATADETYDALSSFTYKLQHMDSSFSSKPPEAFEGTSVIAIYYDLEQLPEELSTEEKAMGRKFWSISDALLADDLEEADWALLIYPTFTGNIDDPVVATVFAVDVKNAVFYKPYAVDERTTMLKNGQRRLFLDPVLFEIEESVLAALWTEETGIDEEYRAGLKYMKEGKYFSAYEAFNDSYATDADEQAQKCVQAWPKNGEIWRSSAAKNKKMQLTIQVNQDADRALFVRIFKDGSPVSYLFIGGTGKVTTKLPAGTYTIKDGSGEMWFGVQESFGRYGSYETMTFNDDGAETIKLKANYAYTITINVQNADPDAAGVGSEYQDWESFSE